MMKYVVIGWGVYPCELSSVCQSDVKICAGRAWINIYITQQNTFSGLSEEFKVLLSSVTKHYISKKEQVARPQRHTKTLKAGI